MPITSVCPYPPGCRAHGLVSTVIISFHSGFPRNARRLFRSYRWSLLASRICLIVGPTTNAPVHCSVSMSRQSSSASMRRVNTFVPAATNVASVVMKVAMWNNGPQFRYT